jgi:hypothetical protein
VDEATKEQLATLLVQSRERELAAAFAEQREPRLRYPAIEIEDVLLTNSISSCMLLA